MTREQHRRARKLFDKALDLPEGERTAFIAESCPDDPAVLREVFRLIKHYVEEGETTAETETDVDSGTPVPGGERWIGPYKVGREIGHGGMGIVYKATQEEPIRRTVALKVIKPELVNSQEVLARFETERQALALMNHPNIARVLDAGADEGGRPYFAMEYVRGVPIHEYCDRHNVPVNDRLEFMIQVCSGVQHAHQKGIIHRDLKPGNILVELQDATPIPRIIDFGVAKAIDQELTGRTVMTEFGRMLGTPEYMSPEQVEMSDLDIDTRTDVYALGVVLYQLLVGDLPFSSKQLREAGWDEMRRMIREETPHKPSTRVSTLGEAWKAIARHRDADPSTLIHEYRGDLDWITMKALEKDRTRRYASASEFAADLQRHLLNEPVSAGPPSAGYRMQKFVRRHRVGVGMVAALIALFLVGFAGTAYGLVRALKAEKQTRLEAATVSEVSEFMFEMFEINDPSESRGNTVTAREILDRGAERIEDDLELQPEVQSRLMESMGKVYRSLGLYGDASRLLGNAVESASAVYGRESPEVARVMTTHAGALIKRGQIERAVPVLEEALRIQEATLEQDDLELARTNNNLAAALRSARKYEECLPYYERSLQIRETALGPDHLDVAKVLSGIGATKIMLKDTDGAREALERALSIREDRLDEDDPVLARTLNSMAMFYRNLKEYDLGRVAAKKALVLQEKALPEDHPDLIKTLLTLGQIERNSGSLDQAREPLERGLAIGEARLPADSRTLGVIRGELVQLYEALGEPERVAEIVGARAVVREE